MSLNKRKRVCRSMDEFLRGTSSFTAIAPASSLPIRQPQSQLQPQPQSDVPIQPQPQPQLQPQPQPDAPTLTSTQATPSGSGTTTKKKGRGFAKGIPDWGNGVKYDLVFNKLMQPIGKTSKPFQSQLGVLAKCGNRLPLTFVTWSEMDDHFKNDLWREVQENTNAPDQYKDNCMHTIHECWKNWKVTVKKHFNPNLPYETMCAKVPPRVKPDQWRTLVQYWRTEDTIKKAEINKANRQQQQYPHRTGRKIFANVRDEMEEAGLETDRINVWCKTRCTTDKEGEDVLEGLDDDTLDVISHMKCKVAEVLVEDRTPEFREKVFTQVMGEDSRGRARTWGGGVSSKDLSGPSSPMGFNSSEKINQLVQEEVSKQMRQWIEHLRPYLEAAGLTTNILLQQQETLVAVRSSVGSNL